LSSTNCAASFGHGFTASRNIDLRHLVVGTAGHIDHGKSALVEALTGIHPDRLKEEQRRGITIDLGFADCNLPPDGVVSFVDVPGHERFVRHMVAGVSGLDVVLLVVAADDGVKPQTREHLAICSLLGMQNGLIILSKADIVERDVRDVVALEVREFLAGTFLEHAPMIVVSSRSGEGLDALRGELRRLLRELPERSPEGIARLSIDRSFVQKGFGTVVTGTLIAGALAEGDEIEILPGGKRGRVRGLQVHRRKVPVVSAGHRVAVNLQGLDNSDAPRGATLTRPAAILTTRRVHATIELLRGAPESLRKGGPVRFHQGTCERAARMRVAAKRADGLLDADLVLSDDTVLLPGDRFILRRPAPVDTIGGGLVVDAHPVRGPFRGGASSPVTEDEVWIERVGRAKLAGRPVAAIAAEFGKSSEEVDAILAPLLESGRLVRAGGLLFARTDWDSVRVSTVDALRAVHEADPLRAGVSRESLRAKLARAMPPEAYRELLQVLAAEGVVRLAGDRLALSTHQVILSPDDAARALKIEQVFRDAELDPPLIEDVLRDVGGPQGPRLRDWLVDEGKLMKIRDGRLFHSEALERLRSRLRDFARTSSTIDIGRFKELAGATRKNAIPLLEQFDEERLTRREGNVRRILTNDAVG
jgi:selenocysteine-specific elongation factor